MGRKTSILKKIYLQTLIFNQKEEQGTEDARLISVKDNFMK